VTADVPEPTLLSTFLGRLASQAGREFERVLAVEITAAGNPQVYHEASRWIAHADPARAIRTTDVWKHHFAHWANHVQAQGHDAAAMAFQSLAESFIAQRRQTLHAEREALQRWLEQRALDLTGNAAPVPQQRDLFEQRPQTDLSVQTASPWAALVDASERLAGFATDVSRPAARRSEADGVLRIHRQRLRDIEGRLAFGASEVMPLGVLMLVPENRHGA
jgi:hypothetical protein